MAVQMKTINNVEMPLRTYAGQRVLTLKDMDNIHGYKYYHFNARFSDMRKRKSDALIENKDYFAVPFEVYNMYVPTGKIGGKGGYLITAEGYEKIVSSTGNEDEYLIKYTSDCYFDDLPVPKKPEPKPEPKEIKHELKLVKTDDKEEKQINNKKLDDIVASIEMLADTMTEFIKFQTKLLDKQQKQHEEFLTELKNVIGGYNNNNVFSTLYTIDGNGNYQEYKETISRAANKMLTICKKYKSTSDVLCDAYKLLRNQYGTVWEQEKKDFLEANGRGPISTLELEWWIERKPVYKNMLVNKLNDMIAKERRE